MAACNAAGLHMLCVAQMVRAPGCGPGGRRFESAHTPHGALAQMVERQTEDLRVSGSIPEGPTNYGRMPESGQKGRTVNPLATACVGSNPTSPTINFQKPSEISSIPEGLSLIQRRRI